MDYYPSGTGSPDKPFRLSVALVMMCRRSNRKGTDKVCFRKHGAFENTLYLFNTEVRRQMNCFSSCFPPALSWRAFPSTHGHCTCWVSGQHTYTYTYVEPEVKAEHLHQLIFTLCFKTGCLIEPGIYQLDLSGRQWAPRNFPHSCLPSAGIIGTQCSNGHFKNMDAGDPNFGLHAYIATSLPTEPAPQPSLYSILLWKKKSLNHLAMICPQQMFKWWYKFIKFIGRCATIHNSSLASSLCSLPSFPFVISSPTYRWVPVLFVILGWFLWHRVTSSKLTHVTCDSHSRVKAIKK